MVLVVETCSRSAAPLRLVAVLLAQGHGPAFQAGRQQRVRREVMEAEASVLPTSTTGMAALAGRERDRLLSKVVTVAPVALVAAAAAAARVALRSVLAVEVAPAWFT